MIQHLNLIGTNIIHSKGRIMATLKEKIKLSADALKIIAIICMFIDHFSFSIVKFYLTLHFDSISVEQYKTFNTVAEVMTSIGRLAFPIFVFFLVEGFFRTRNVAKYALRLAVFAFVSEFPFNLGLYHRVFYSDHQNVMFTLLIGLLAMWLCSYLMKQPFSNGLIIFLFACVTAAAITLSEIIKSDYQWKGILLIMAIYFVRLLGCKGLLAGAAVSSTFEKFGGLSFLLLYFYDADKKPRYKFLFYIFYPAHLLLIYGISVLAGL